MLFKYWVVMGDPESGGNALKYGRIALTSQMIQKDLYLPPIHTPSKIVQNILKTFWPVGQGKLGSWRLYTSHGENCGILACPKYTEPFKK